MAAATEITVGAVVRVPAGGGYKRSWCLQVQRRDPTSRETGNVPVSGIVLGADGTTARARPLHRSTVLIPGRVTVIRKGTPPGFTAKIGVTTLRWHVVSDETGNPLLGADGITPWHAREYSEMTDEERRLRRDPVTQVMDRVRQERGILHLDRLTYDLSAWPHDSEMVLVDSTVGGKRWQCTYVCKRCGLPLKLVPNSGRFTSADDDDECHGETWVP